MNKFLLIFLGGGLGAISRYGISAFVNRMYSVNIPLGTMFVNVLGSFFLGFLWAFVGPKVIFPSEIKAFFMVGFLGAFTTFSTYSFETVSLFQRSLYVSAISNIFLSTSLSLLFAFLGIYVGKSLSSVLHV